MVVVRVGVYVLVVVAEGEGRRCLSRVESAILRWERYGFPSPAAVLPSSPQGPRKIHEPLLESAAPRVPQGRGFSINMGFPEPLAPSSPPYLAAAAASTPSGPSPRPAATDRV